MHSTKQNYYFPVCCEWLWVSERKEQNQRTYSSGNVRWRGPNQLSGLSGRPVPASSQWLWLVLVHSSKCRRSVWLLFRALVFVLVVCFLCCVYGKHSNCKQKSLLVTKRKRDLFSLRLVLCAGCEPNTGFTWVCWNKSGLIFAVVYSDVYRRTEFL